MQFGIFSEKSIFKVAILSRVMSSFISF